MTVVLIVMLVHQNNLNNDHRSMYVFNDLN